MRQASVKEDKYKWLPEVLPSIHELIFYLTKLNDSIMVYVKKIYKNQEDGQNIYEMSNGSSYTKDNDGNWYML